MNNNLTTTQTCLDDQTSVGLSSQFRPTMLACHQWQSSQAAYELPTLAKAARAITTSHEAGKNIYSHPQAERSMADLPPQVQPNEKGRSANVAGPEAYNHAQAILNSIGDAVLSIDASAQVTYLNPMAESLTGWSREEATGRPLTEVFQVVDGVTRQAVPNQITRAIDENKTVHLASNCLLIRRDGREYAIADSSAPIRNQNGQATGAVIVFRDVTAERAQSEHLAYLAQHDHLTGLPNRLVLSDRLEQAIALARRHNKRGAVLFVDLDGFKHINDSLGHAVGDKLLQSAAQRLVGGLRDSDTVSRHGGDEFVILLSEIEHPHDATLRAEKMLQSLAEPHAILGRNLDITASIGISIYPDDGDDAETLLRRADSAMYQAKNYGRNTTRSSTGL